MTYPGPSWLSRLAGLAPVQPLQQSLAGLLPSQCLVCRRWPGHSLCADCLARWARPVHRCRLCAIALPLPAVVCGQCLRHPPALARCVAAVDYAWPWRSLLGEFKFQGNTALALSLARLLLRDAQVHSLLQPDVVLVSVPLSRERLRQRGFDQTALIARALAPRLLLPRGIERAHTLVEQHRLTRQQRLKALHDVFSVTAVARQRIEGRSVVLLDDVMTTGATLQALAGCMLRAGAVQVSAIAVARTPL